MNRVKINVTTLNEFMINNSHEHKNLNKIYRQIVFACKVISNRIRRAGLEDLYGSTTVTNFHGEEVKTLDVISNDLFIKSLSKIRDIYALVSEENNNIISLNKNGNYIVTFDPLDGSSNIDSNVNIGSIFGIYKKNVVDNKENEENEDLNINILQSGDNMISAGYCLYGTSTMFILATDKDVNGFTLDENFGEFILTHVDMKVPINKKVYSVNEGNYDSWTSDIQKLIDLFKKSKYSGRYIGSMVGDVHRTIIQGGVFMYPASSSAKNGKLRLLYEVAPMSYIIEKAGGVALSSSSIRALSIIPVHIHQRVPIFLGSRENMSVVKSLID